MNAHKLGFYAIMAIAAFLILGQIFFPYYTYKSDVVIVVDDKERTGGADGRYLIFAQDEVFENTDSWFYAKFNSSTLYNSLESGRTYKCDVNGVRFPIFSMYRNLIQCTEMAS